MQCLALNSIAVILLQVQIHTFQSLLTFTGCW